MKNRIKMNAPALKSRAQAEETLRSIAELTLSRNRAQLDMDQEITTIRERYEEAIGEANKALEEKTELVRAWADANPSEFNGLKSLGFVHAVIGWRTGQPTLKTLAGWTWDRVLEKLETLRLYPNYIRTKREVDKQSILADREKLADQGTLKEIGVRVVQDESFFIEPNLTELETKQAA